MGQTLFPELQKWECGGRKGLGCRGGEEESRHTCDMTLGAQIGWFKGEGTVYIKTIKANSIVNMRAKLKQKQWTVLLGIWLILKYNTRVVNDYVKLMNMIDQTNILLEGGCYMYGVLNFPKSRHF